MSEKVRIAAISAVASVVVALVTGVLSAIATTRQQVAAQRTEIVQEISGQVSVTGVPIGTVVPSMLDPRSFSKLAGDEGSFDYRRSIWVPADGREVPGSRYASELSSHVPDLRGLFIRGLNRSESDRDRLTEPGNQTWADPDGANRQPGAPQADALAEHGHEAAGAHQIAGGVGYWALSPEDVNKSHNRVIPPSGGKETRPKNAALYYYIKIN